jgi:hypothetical protein
MKIYIEQLKLSRKMSRDVAIVMVDESNDNDVLMVQVVFLRLFRNG